MRSWVAAAIIIVGGLGVIIGVSAALANDDNTGQTVGADDWADDARGQDRQAVREAAGRLLAG